MSPTPSHVVIGFDLGPSSVAALRHGIALAATAPRHVLHVVCAIEPHQAISGYPAPDGVDYHYAERIQQVVSQGVQRELEAAAPSTPIHFFVHARIGRPADEILGVAADVGAERIIVGSHGGRVLEQLLLGSVSQRVATQAKCTVEIARPNGYPRVALEQVTEVPGHHGHVAPHRYSYEDRRINLRPLDWPMY